MVPASRPHPIRDIGQEIRGESRAELEAVAALLRVVATLTPESLRSRAHPRSRSLLEAAWHLAGLPLYLENLLRQGSYDLAANRPAAASGADRDQQPGPEAAVLLPRFEAAAATARRLLEEADDALWNEDWSLLDDGAPRERWRRAHAVRVYFLNHSRHHRAQLHLLLRLASRGGSLST